MSKDEENHWKQLEERVIFRNKYIGLRNDLVQMPNGKETEYAVIEGKDFVTVLCKASSNKIVLAKCFIYPWNTLTRTAVGGVIESGETPEQAAKREAEEETGYNIKQVTFLQKCHPTFLNIAWNYIFFAETENRKSVGPEDSNEIINVQEFSTEEVLAMIEKGEITHSSSILAIYTALTKNLI